MTTEYEEVFAITYFFDSIREGVANYKGRPHFFQEELDQNTDEYSGMFSVFLASDEILSMAIEYSEIKERYWSSEYNNSVGDSEELPRALPEDRENCRVIEAYFEDLSKISFEDSLKVKAEFRSKKVPGKSLSEVEVKWT